MSRKVRRALKFDCPRESVEEMRRLHQQGYDMGGNWDLAKCCQHLTKTMRMSVESVPFVLPFFVRPIARWMLFRTVMAGEPTRLPLIAPKSFQPDADDTQKAIAEFEAAVNAVMADDVPFVPNHPVFGKVSKEEWRKFHAWHAAHHFSHLIPKDQTSPSADSQSTSQAKV